LHEKVYYGLVVERNGPVDGEAAIIVDGGDEFGVCLEGPYVTSIDVSSVEMMDLRLEAILLVSLDHGVSLVG